MNGFKKEKRGGICFYNCDNIAFMKTKPDNYYDLAIVDPPYGINICFSPDGKHIVTDRKSKDGKYSSLAREKWDSKPTKEYFDELFRVSKNQIIWGGQFFVEYLPPKQCWIVWDKMNGNSSFSDCEIAFTSFSVGLRIFRKTIETKNKIHITQKPIKLYRWILLRFAKQGMKILDTHGGSHTHAIAADMEGFDLDICENDIIYHKDGVNAYNEYKRQAKLF